MKIMKNNDIYEAPTMIVVEVKQEGVICGSLTAPDDYPGGGDPLNF